jgi:hypothetical protein
MASKKRPEMVLHELIALAEEKNIEVRTEKLLREVGYHARSGRCRVRGKKLIIVDRDEPLREQIDFLVHELAREQFDPDHLPEPIKKLLVQKLQRSSLQPE